MGGSRAKERRHLERVEKQKEYHRRHGGKFQPPDPAIVLKNANNNGSFDVYHEDDKPPLSLPPPTPPISSEPKKGGDGSAKQKVVKKPKHLKRKLLCLNPEKQNQRVVQEETTSSREIKERERILGEIQKWESQKVAHRHNTTLSKATIRQHDDIKSQSEKSSRPQSLNPKKQSLPSKPAAPMIKSDFSRNVKPKCSVKSAAIRANEKSNKEGSIEQSLEQAPSSKSPSGARDEAASSSSSAKEQAEDKVSTRAKTESESAATKDVTMKKKFDDDVAAVKKSNIRSSNELDDDDDNDDDDNILKDDSEKRQRGKRRRGRKDTSKNIPKEGEHQEQEEKDKMSIEQQENPKEKDASTVDAPAMEENKRHELNSEEQKKQSKENDGRYCIGRKPVTDFIIGQTYPGKIVYMKPFGVFFDLGCHKDAFCHVSRLQDDYVKSPDSLFQVGDVVESCRVVEIDRKQQRITVSLQSIVRIQDERASVDARKGRQNKRKKSSSSSSFAHQGSPQKQKKMSNLIEKDASPAAPSVAFVGNVKNSTGGMNSHVAIKNKPPPPPHVGMEQKGHNAGQQEAVGLTPAEQKRARKLARRASRREEKEAEK